MRLAGLDLATAYAFLSCFELPEANPPTIRPSSDLFGFAAQRRTDTKHSLSGNRQRFQGDTWYRSTMFNEHKEIE